MGGDIAPSLSFHVLGPIDVERDGRRIELGSAKVRGLLALLVLHANELVSRDRLIEDLWGGRPPATAEHGLSVHISRLRKLLDGESGSDVLVTRPGGYVLRVDPEQIDASVFERLTAEGRKALEAGRPSSAAETLRRALSLWHGPPLADVAFEPFAVVEAERLEELRLEALESRIAADLALGRQGELIAELTALVAEHPLRERLVGQLMLCLYRAGRQAEALDVYRDARQRLVEELGIEPSASLQRLQREILQHSPELDAEAPPSPPSPPLRPSPAGASPHARRRRDWIVLGVGATLAVSAAAIWAPAFHGRDHVGPVAGDAVALLDASSASAKWSTRLQEAPGRVAVAKRELWVTEPRAGRVARIEADGSVRQEVKIGTDSYGIATGGGAVWVTSPGDGTVSRIDPQTGQVVQVIRVGNSPTAIAYAQGAVWVANHGDRTLSHIDAGTGRVVGTIAADADGSGIAFGSGSLWVTDAPGGRVVQIDPRTNLAVRAIPVGNEPDAVVAAGEVVWVANRMDGTVSQIDVRRGSVRQTISVGAEPVDLAVARGRLWVANAVSGTLVQIDPGRGVVDRTIAVAGEPQGLDATPDGIAAAVAGAGAAHRGGVLRLLGISPMLVESIDPATIANPIEAGLAGLSGDGLVAVRREAGVDGTRLVPDLAVSLPAPTEGARTYTFELRPGLRYSDGTPVRASDARASLERMFRAHSYGAGYYAALVGAGRCLAQPARCDLRQGVVADDRSRTITFRLVAPDPDFFAKLTLPEAYLLPAGTPLPGRVPRPVPATGPYRVVSFHPGNSLVLSRNPRFRQYSTARPAGFAARIALRLVPDTPSTIDEAIRAVATGRADYIDLVGSLVPRVAVADRSRLHLWLAPSTLFYLLNAGIPPFDSLDARRAFSFALARTTSERAGHPTCQILPPDFPAYRRYCPYTISPRSGRWTAPDLEQARQLVRRSGTSGTHITVWTPQTPGFRERTLTAANALRRIGYRVTTKAVSDQQYARLYERRGVQIMMASWSADYPSPANFFTNLLQCGRNIFPSFPCDPVVGRAIERALKSAASDPAAAGRLWTAVDRLATDRAVLVPVSNPLSWTFVSERTGNYKANPIFGPLLDQLWVR